MIPHAVRVFALGLFVFLLPALALAQTATPAPVAAPPPSPRVAGGQDGFAVESGNGDYRLQIGLLLHADGRFGVADDNNQVVDTFAVRRIRPYLRGRLGRRFEFYLNPDFAGSTLVVQDAYLDTIFSPAFRLRAGKGKVPFGFERLHSASNILFMERAFPTALAPNRDAGVQVLGDLAGGRVSYLAAVTNGVTDGASADLDTADTKDLAGRVVVRPARGLAIGVAGTRGGATGTALPSFRTQTLQQPFFGYVAGTVANGNRSRVSPSVSYFNKAFGGWAEYVKSTTPVARGVLAAEAEHEAWQVAGSWVLTGENATDAGAGIRPRANFDFGNGNWGAFQVAARVHSLEVDEDALPPGFAAAGASHTARAWTLGLNWYLTGNFRYTFNFERTVFDGDPDGPRRAENTLAFRTQINF